MKVAVSYLKSDDYKKCIEAINDTSADLLHVDMCDGKYVETKNFTISEILKLLPVSKKQLDIHLMVEDPDKYIDDLSLLNACTITFHKLGSINPMETINHIKSVGLQVGMAINPDEEIDTIKEYLPYLDLVLIMSVVPGKGGQAFMSEVLPKVDKLNELKKDYHFFIGIDGGINGSTISQVNGVDLVISGSYVTTSLDYEEAIRSLR